MDEELNILASIKKSLGIDPTYTAFDDTIIMHINTVLLTLNQLDIGPTEGFQINKDTLWDEYLDIFNNYNLNAVKTYIYLKVKLIFDPPTNSSVIEAMKEQIKELEWRLNDNCMTNLNGGEDIE